MFLPATPTARYFSRLYREYGVGMFEKLDAEFAMIIYDGEKKEFIAARDPIGIRPLFFGYDSEGAIIFASEAKNLVPLCKKVIPFPPGHYYAGGKFIRYRDISKAETYIHDGIDTVCLNIKNKLIAGIEKRLDADAPVGFLLSGGLDSSLVCAVSARLLKKPIKTFAIGMSGDAIDLKYAKEARRLHRKRPHGGHNLEGRRHCGASEGHIGPRHIRYNDDPRVGGNVSCL